MIQKPEILKVEEFNQKLMQLIRTSEIPSYVIRSTLQLVVNEISVIAANELQIAAQKYQKECEADYEKQHQDAVNAADASNTDSTTANSTK